MIESIEILKTENAALRSLIQHCWIHSNYRDCGYLQMTTEEKALYDEVIGRNKEGEADAGTYR